MRKGFTLIEMAIVLLIIGIIIGGIIAGRSLIETAKIQRLMKDLAQYEVATNKFKEAYQYYPGDSPDFTPPGGGDNILNGGVECGESFQLFAHLSQAEMLEQTYVPFQPPVCGGTQDDNLRITGGVIGPYTELSSAGAAALSLRTRRIDPQLAGPNSPVILNLVVDPAFVIPLEAKLGSSVSNPGGTGKCTASSGYVSCTASNAQYGNLAWSFRVK